MTESKVNKDVHHFYQLQNAITSCNAVKDQSRTHTPAASFKAIVLVLSVTGKHAKVHEYLPKDCVRVKIEVVKSKQSCLPSSVHNQLGCFIKSQLLNAW